MSEKNHDGTPIFTDQGARREQIVTRFEDAWNRQERPSIQDYLTGEGDERRAILVELVHADLECRLKAGESARVEEYLKRYPELTRDDDLVVELISAEYTLRRRAEPSLAIDEYLHRFPRYQQQLAKRLTREPSLLPGKRFPIRLNCPHCKNPITVIDDMAEDEVVCPSCGSSFRLDRDRTVSWRPEKLPRLGKLKLLEVVGRGAFGTVYRARDTELDRIVTVKLPRSGIFATKEDEDRFVREARSVAQLHHSGIVPVYEVGHSESFPYIVTQYVEGITLSDALSGRRFSFRESAEIIVEVAEALDHSHKQGVIHRDLKPSNIMLQKADHPRALLMDFGLARRDEGEITVTVEGQILGTPAYMSPEQARGESHRVDGRSDVYSLGVVLYELLVGELPFRGNSRMLLHQVLYVEPRSPRGLNDHIPRDLETIALKCMAKEPGRRYQTAGELAADLRRWLEGKPIHARPVGRLQRLWRWAKRNPRLATLTGVVFLLLVTTAAVSTIAALVVNKARQQAQTLAENNRALAENEQIARRRAEDLEQEALHGWREARNAVDAWLTGTGEALKFYPGMQRIRERLLQQAVQDYESLARHRADDTLGEIERGRTFLRLGDVRRSLGEIPEAEQAYRSAELLLSKLSQSHPDLLDCRLELANSGIKLGLLQADIGRHAEADRTYSSVIAELRALMEAYQHEPRFRAALSTSLLNRGALLTKTDSRQEAEEMLRKAVGEFQHLVQAEPDESRYREGVSGARSMLGRILVEDGRHEEAFTQFDRAISSFDALLKEDPERPDYLEARASTRIYLASVQRRLGRYTEELAAYRASMADYQSLMEAMPEVPLYRENLALTRIDLGQLLYKLGDTAETQSQLDHAQAVITGLLAVYPQIPRYHEEQAACHDTLGQVLSDLGRNEEAKSACQSAVTSYQKLVEAFPDVPEYWERLAVSRGHLGQVLHKLAEHEAACQAYHAAINTLDELIRQAPNIPSYRDQMAFVQEHLGVLLLETNDAAGAEKTFRRALELWQDLVKQWPAPEYLQNLAWFLVNCPDPQLRDAQQAIELAKQATEQTPQNAFYCNTLGVAYYRAGDWQASVENLHQAIRLRGEGNSRDWFFLGMAQWQLGESEEAAAGYRRACQWMQQNRPDNLELKRIRHEAGRLLGLSQQKAPRESQGL